MSRAFLRQGIKRLLDAGCIILVAPLGGLCALEAARDVHRDTIFSFCAHVFALMPGLPGAFLRRAFYRLTLDSCQGSFHVGFGAFFSHRQSTVEDGVYIGPYSIVGSSRLRRGSLIGSRAGIISGAGLHEFDADGRRMPTDPQRLRQLDIGEDVWIGEGCLIMADVGQSSTVAAGSVVSSRVPSGVVVAGNPARFVRHVAQAKVQETVSAAV